MRGRGPNFVDLTGQLFGKWTVIQWVKKPVTSTAKGAHYLCRCACGVERILVANSLKSGHSTSCGCGKQRESYVGSRFGRLVVLTDNDSGKHRKCLCRCDCGKQVPVGSYGLTTGNSKSCGCLKRELQSKRARKHGDVTWVGKKLIVTPEYKSWQGMLSRCRNENNVDYRNYGGRGITVFVDWVTSYEKFLAYVGRRPGPRYSIDRINVNGNYEPGNVRWATQKQQAQNRRNTLCIDIDGVSVPLAVAAEKSGVKYATAARRLLSGRPVAEVLCGEKLKPQCSRLYQGLTRDQVKAYIAGRSIGLGTVLQRLLRGVPIEIAISEMNP